MGDASKNLVFGVIPEQNMKWVALFLLVVQNTALVLLMRSSLTSSGDHYIVTTAVACMECVKVITCLFVESSGSKTWGDFVIHIHSEVFKPIELLKLSVPSLLYTLQNNLLYIALANLDSATYQVCYQLKILTTAIFSVFLLKRVLNKAKWISLIILTIGVSLTELDASNGAKSKGKHHIGDEVIQNPALGFVCVLMACVTSGFAGVWFEKILKNSNTSMWIRNIQMGVTSVAIALFAVYTKDNTVVMEKGFFYGYNKSVIGVILLQAMGGLVVAMVVRYADNILKGFGSSISIVISCILEWLFFDFQPTLRFIFGAGLVNYAVFLYQEDGSRGASKSISTSSSSPSSSSLPTTICNIAPAAAAVASLPACNDTLLKSTSTTTKWKGSNWFANGGWLAVPERPSSAADILLEDSQLNKSQSTRSGSQLAQRTTVVSV